jgi:hypothetical protein
VIDVKRSTAIQPSNDTMATSRVSDIDSSENGCLQVR